MSSATSLSPKYTQRKEREIEIARIRAQEAALERDMQLLSQTYCTVDVSRTLFELQALQQTLKANTTEYHAIVSFVSHVDHLLHKEQLLLTMEQRQTFVTLQAAAKEALARAQRGSAHSSFPSSSATPQKSPTSAAAGGGGSKTTSPVQQQQRHRQQEQTPPRMSPVSALARVASHQSLVNMSFTGVGGAVRTSHGSTPLLSPSRQTSQPRLDQAGKELHGLPPALQAALSSRGASAAAVAQQPLFFQKGMATEVADSQKKSDMPRPSIDNEERDSSVSSLHSRTNSQATLTVTNSLSATASPHGAAVARATAVASATAAVERELASSQTQTGLFSPLQDDSAKGPLYEVGGGGDSISSPPPPPHSSYVVSGYPYHPHVSSPPLLAELASISSYPASPPPRTRQPLSLRQQQQQSVAHYSSAHSTTTTVDEGVGGAAANPSSFALPPIGGSPPPPLPLAPPSPTHSSFSLTARAVPVAAAATAPQTCYTASGAFHFGFTQSEVDEKISAAIAERQKDWQAKQDEQLAQMQQLIQTVQERQAALQVELGAAKERATFYEASTKKQTEIIEQLTNRLYRSESEKRKLEEEEQLQLGLLQHAVKGVQRSYFPSVSTTAAAAPAVVTPTTWAVVGKEAVGGSDSGHTAAAAPSTLPPSVSSSSVQQQLLQQQGHVVVTAEDVPTYELAEE